MKKEMPSENSKAITFRAEVELIFRFQSNLLQISRKKSRQRRISQTDVLKEIVNLYANESNIDLLASVHDYLDEHSLSLCHFLGALLKQR